MSVQFSSTSCGLCKRQAVLKLYYQEFKQGLIRKGGNCHNSPNNPFSFLEWTKGLSLVGRMDGRIYILFEFGRVESFIHGVKSYFFVLEMTDFWVSERLTS